LARGAPVRATGRGVYLFELIVQDTRVLPSFRQLFPSLQQTFLGNPRRVATVAIVLLVLMGTGAGILARHYDATRLRLARAELSAGANEATSHPEDAVEHYRAALALDRENPAIRRALAVQLFELGRSDEAETHLIELLQMDPIDAEANLLRARIAIRREDDVDAETFYERAIYGRWSGESDAEAAAQRIAARFELLDLLSRTGARIQARAELLRLQAELPNVPRLQHELAGRFLALGDAAQAADVLQKLMKQHSTDVDAARSLTDALLTLGRFREARDAASHALALAPQDHATRERLDQINDALSLDPTLRGLSPGARLRRSGDLLARVLQDVESCMAALSPAPQQQTDWSALHARAQTAIAAKPPSPRETDALDALTDQRLAIADELWRLRANACGIPAGPLAWVMEHLGH
jgi:Flp pilus assembly protein TadD